MPSTDHVHTPPSKASELTHVMHVGREETDKLVRVTRRSPAASMRIPAFLLEASSLSCTSSIEIFGSFARSWEREKSPRDEKRK